MFNVFVAFVFVLLGACGALAGELRIITEPNPPLNYTEDGTEQGRVIGQSVEIVQEAQRRMDDRAPIQVMPWARGYKLAQTEPDTMLFSTTRTAAREKLFKWAGPIATNEWVFFARKGSGVRISDLEEAKRIRRIGAYRDDVREQFLKEQGFANVHSASDPRMCLKMLLAGRIDLWISDMLEGLMTAKESGVAPGEIEPVYSIRKAELYCAFSPGTPDEVVDRWQGTLDQMKADGTFQRITGKWSR